MDLSVVIPCFNAEGTIAIQLEALAAQKWDKPWEIVVADNGSTDRSVEIIRTFQPRLPNLRVVDASALRRQSFALNTGAQAAAGKALVFCDADDEVAPGWLAIIGDALARHQVVHGQICFDKFNTREEAEPLSKLWKGGLYRGQFLPHAGAANIGVQRSVHEAVGGFDTNLPRFADSNYSWRLQLEGYELHYESGAIYQYRISRVNPSLRYLFRRGWTAPAADYWTYKKFRGIGVTKDMVLPRHRTFKRSMVSWWQTLRNMPRACWQSRQSRLAWVQRFVTLTGEVYGQCRGRLASPCDPYVPRSDAYRAKIDFNFRTVR